MRSAQIRPEVIRSFGMPKQPQGARLQEGWVIANHILVSFHVAFISSVLALPAASIFKSDVLKFIFLSPETLVSALFLYISFHTGIAVHEMGHFLTAARLNALSQHLTEPIRAKLEQPIFDRLLYYARVFALAPYGRAEGIKREALNYYPDAPYNLAVAAAGPRASRNLAWSALPPAIVLIALGLLTDTTLLIYVGRLLLGLGTVGLLDFFLADRGKYAEFKQREARARKAAATVAAAADSTSWYELAPRLKKQMLEERLQHADHPRLGRISAPWQYRNCGMGGRHTEKEYPESNISMQEAMFVILGASDFQEAQEMTVRLQNRLKEIIEKEPGCRVMGIGLEGGLAPYIDKGDYPLAEMRLWALMKKTIEECGYRPGMDVAIALDPAMSELENAYREEYNIPDAVGMYLFWRDKTKTVLDPDGVLAIYEQAIRKYEIPIISIEDGFSENDHNGWAKLLSTFGDRLWIIGDDLVTTNDRTIDMAAGKSLINTALIKANQIGTLYETLLAMLVALGKRLEIVVSHRSKSPNDDMEAHIGLAVNALGLKCGGGANTERLVKYQSVAALMRRAPEAGRVPALQEGQVATVKRIWGYEEPTNAGIPTVGAELEVELVGANVALRFSGATPLGTSAGSGEAIHLVDATIEEAEHREVVSSHRDLFDKVEPGVFKFRKGVGSDRVRAAADEELRAVFERTQRYAGKGCLNAADNVWQTIAPYFEGGNLVGRGVLQIDRDLLNLELRTGWRRGKTEKSCSPETAVAVMQRKQNLGMNAILSVSLALTRAIAHIRGKQLYELLREEMIDLISRLAAECGVRITGSQWIDYVKALQECSRVLDQQGRELYVELRRLSGIYEVSAAAEAAAAVLAAPAAAMAQTASSGGGMAAAQATATAAAAGTAAQAMATATAAAAGPAGHAVATAAAAGPSGRAMAAAVEPAGPAPAAAPALAMGDLLSEEEQQKLASITAELVRSFTEGAGTPRQEVLREFLVGAESLASPSRTFEIVSNRLLKAGDQVLVPYRIDGALVIYVARQNGVVARPPRLLAPGVILTDALVTSFAGLDTAAAPIEPIDLENRLYEFDAPPAGEIHIARLRDISALLAAVNECHNIHQADYYIRFLVAGLGGLAFRAFVGAKNLQPEIRQLMDELARLLNGPHGKRLRFSARILVRNLAALVLRPNLIDELWNTTIDLAEVHVRGSAIINELRRSSHHALGQRTLRLARAYLAYLETGNVQPLAELGFEELSPADVEARQRAQLPEMFRRIVADLEKLLETSETISRIQEWRDTFAESLLRCEFENSLDTELESLVSEGIRENNRWIYHHRLRIIRKKAESFQFAPEIASQVRGSLQELERIGLQDGTPDPGPWEEKARNCVNGLIRTIQSIFQDALFAELDAVIDSSRVQPPRATFERICALRYDVSRRIERGGFAELRCHLFQLDCFLEEMGYLELRRIAVEFEERGVDLPLCFEIIRRSVKNLACSGFTSQELDDIGAMLGNRAQTRHELTNIVDYIKELYQKVMRRATTPYEAMAAQLQLSDQDLTVLLGNLKRYMHDLNGIAQFCDIAREKLQSERVEGVLFAAPETKAPERRTIHISHQSEIREQLNAGINFRELYGGKATGLLYISLLGLPTRDGFILPTPLSHNGSGTPDAGELEREILQHVQALERDIVMSSGRPKRYGSPVTPLLLAVRGGSVFSMPGMLSTVVFVGMNDRIAAAMAELDPWQAYDAYRRFLGSYAQAVWGVGMESFGLVEAAKERYGVRFKHELPWEAMREIAEASKAILRDKGFGGELEAVLEDLPRQLFCAVRAVHASWDSKRARRYREIKGLCNSWQTAAIVQEMAFGNRHNEYVGEGMDETRASLTGVIPRTDITPSGMCGLTGEIKFSAAGDDLVGGLATASSIFPVAALPKVMPMLHRRLLRIVTTLRRYMGTDQEIEFTIDHGELSILQTRMAQTVQERKVNSFTGQHVALTVGVGVRGSAFRGIVAFDEAGRKEMASRIQAGRDGIDGVLLVLENPTPDDIPLILSADGLLTARGGSTSHAAIAVNSIEKREFCAVLGARGLKVSAGKSEAVFFGADHQVVHRVQSGDVLSLHGRSGEVFAGSLPLFE